MLPPGERVWINVIIITHPKADTGLTVPWRIGGWVDRQKSAVRLCTVQPILIHSFIENVWPMRAIENTDTLPLHSVIRQFDSFRHPGCFLVIESRWIWEDHFPGMESHGKWWCHVIFTVALSNYVKTSILLVQYSQCWYALAPGSSACNINGM